MCHVKSLLWLLCGFPECFVSNVAMLLDEDAALLDKEDVKEFTLGYADMSAYQQSKTIWDMMC